MTYEICNINVYSDAQYDAMYRAAASDRRARADRFRHEDDRKRCLCADALARNMLARAADIAPEKINFTYSDKGKPRANLPLYFNVSHSGEWVLCAVSETPVGADIEQIKPFRAGMVGRYFTDAEAAYIWDGKPVPGNSPVPEGNVIDPDVCARFYRVWTAKEAYVKMTGTGISTDLSAVKYDPATQTVCGMPLITTNAPEGYVISIVKKVLPQWGE